MFRKLYLILFVTLLPLASFGQKTYLTGHLGSQSTIINRQYSDFAFSTPGFNFGVSVKRLSPIGNYFETGIQIVQKSSVAYDGKFDPLSSFFSPYTIYTFQYMSLPIYWGFRTGKLNYVDIGVGVVGEYLIAANKSGLTSFRGNVFQVPLISLQNQAFPFQLGYIARLGVGRYFSEHYSVEIRTNVQNNSTAALKGYKYKNFQLINVGIQLCVSYNFFE